VRDRAGRPIGIQLAHVTGVLTQGRDYLFFERVDYTQLSLITTMTRCALVITPNLIVVIPLEAMDEGDALRFVRALLADPAIDVDKLENALTSIYAGSHSRWVFPIAQLETFKATSGFFGMISLRMPRESMRRLVIRDKGGKTAAKQFFEARTSRRPSQRGRSSDLSLSTPSASPTSSRVAR
jgi:hypothetical protein